MCKYITNYIFRFKTTHVETGAVGRRIVLKSVTFSSWASFAEDARRDM